MVAAGWQASGPIPAMPTSSGARQLDRYAADQVPDRANSADYSSMNSWSCHQQIAAMPAMARYYAQPGSSSVALGSAWEAASTQSSPEDGTSSGPSMPCAMPYRQLDHGVIRPIPGQLRTGRYHDLAVAAGCACAAVPSWGCSSCSRTRASLSIAGNPDARTDIGVDPLPRSIRSARCHARDRLDQATLGRSIHGRWGCTGGGFSRSLKLRRPRHPQRRPLWQFGGDGISGIRSRCPAGARSIWRPAGIWYSDCSPIVRHYPQHGYKPFSDQTRQAHFGPAFRIAPW